MPAHRFRQFVAILLTALAVLGFSTAGANSRPGNHESEREETGLAGTLRLNVSPNGYPPYLIVENEQYSGIIWDTVTAIADRLDVQVAPIKIPRKRVDELVMKGYIDATPRAIEWTDHPENYLYTDPIVHVEEVFFYRTSDPFDYASKFDLDSKTIVTHLGYQYPSLSPMFEDGLTQRFDVTGDVEMFRYLLDGRRFDAAIADRLVGQWIIRNTPDMSGSLRATDASISNYGFRLMVRKDLEAFVRQFNAELTALKTDGGMEQILDRYR